MQLLTNKIPLGISIVVVLLLMFNNAERLHINSQNKARTNEQKNIIELVLPQANAEVASLLNNKYQQYRVIKNKKTKNKKGKKTKTAAQLAAEKAAKEAKQKGRLKNVLSGDYVLRLKAIIENKSNTVALIELRNTKTKKTTIESFALNSQLTDFVIHKIANTGVVMSRQLNNKRQELTLVMYE